MIETAWIWGLAGGLMIGCAGAIYLLGLGRIMGASGIVGGLIDGTGDSRGMRLAFLAGLIGAPALWALTALPVTNTTSSIPLLIIGGLLVGFGTRWANGCTSGHGVCGISRLSGRGIGATLIFLTSGAVTMFIARHLLGVI